MSCAALAGTGCVRLAAQQSVDSASQSSGQPEGQSRRSTDRGTAGTITAINGSTLTIKQAANDSTMTVKVTDKTEFRKNREPATLSDFKVGDFVIVRGEHTSANEITAEAVMSGPGGERRFVFQAPGSSGAAQFNMADLGNTFVVGQVKAIDGVKITVHRPDDKDQTIQVDESTSFRKGGESITLPDVKVGDAVMARGGRKDGVFVPSQLNVVDAQRVQFRQRAPEQEKPPSPPQ